MKKKPIAVPMLGRGHNVYNRLATTRSDSKPFEQDRWAPGDFGEPKRFRAHGLKLTQTKARYRSPPSQLCIVSPTESRYAGIQTDGD